MTKSLTLGTDIGDWTDDPAPENDPYSDPNWPPPSPPSTPEQVCNPWRLRDGEKLRGYGMNATKRGIVERENLELIQVYKQLFLAECRNCKTLLTFPVSEEDQTWSCVTCDKVKIAYFLKHDAPAEAHHLAA